MNLAQETKISFASTDEFYQKMVEVTQQQAAKIERKTRLQSGCDEWFQQRRLRLTATNGPSVRILFADAKQM